MLKPLLVASAILMIPVWTACPDVITTAGVCTDNPQSSCPPVTVGAECREPICQDGGCAVGIKAGFCYDLQEERCIADGASSPTDACRVCDPSATQTSLVAKPCPSGQVCQAGDCVTPSPDVVTTPDTIATDTAADATFDTVAPADAGPDAAPDVQPDVIADADATPDADATSDADASVGPGCTDPDAANYDPNATANDGTCEYEVAFSVDMSCAGVSYTNVQLSGPWCSWCDDVVMEDADGDGIFTFTTALPPGEVEYKYHVDAFASQEDLWDDVQAGTGDCAPSNGSGSPPFANRVLTVVDGPVAVDDVYGRCSECPTDGCTDPDAANYVETATTDDGSCEYALTFSVDMTCSGLTYTDVFVTGPWCNWCADALMTDEDNDGIYTTTVQLAPNAHEYLYHVDGFASQENLWDNVLNGESCAPVNGFGTPPYANRQVQISDAPVSTSDVFGRCDACPVGAISGCTSSLAPNFDPAATVDDGSCFEPVTFEVDMNCAGISFSTVHVTGPFCGWCNQGYDLTDPDGDGVYTGTYYFDDDVIEYKYMVDLFVAQEDLLDDVQGGDGACAPVNDGASFANRQLTIVSGGQTVMETYGSCEACP